MKLEVIVEDLLLKNMVGSARDEYRPILDLQENALIRRFGTRTTDAVQALETLNRSSLMFAGAYLSVKSKLNSEGIFTESIPDAFKRAYSAYCASQAVIQFLNKKYGGNEQKQHKNPRPLSGFSMELGLRDYNAVADVLENLTKYATGISTADQINSEITNYFDFISYYCLEKICGPVMFAYKDTVDNLKVKGTYFAIAGLARIKKSEDKKPSNKSSRIENSFKKDPTIVTLDKSISKMDVIGNEDALNAVENSVHHLMAYDKNERKNPYLYDGGFKQFILLVGDSGGGKTLTFKYGISEAKRLAELNNLDFMAVSLDFEDSYQDGPLQILRHQLNSIVNDNQAYLIFVDEMESKFSSRKSLGPSESYETKTIREFLDFSNGLGYPNRGNYVLLGASNLPKKIDKAIRSRFKKGTYLCEGPKTTEQKAKVLYNNLIEGINAGYVEVQDWCRMGELAFELNLSGRDLYECATNIIERSRTNHFPQGFFQLNFTDKLKVIKSKHDLIDDTKLEESLYEIADKKEHVEQASLQFMLE
jgi:AAA+ superfamily predicted ATPase